MITVSSSNHWRRNRGGGGGGTREKREGQHPMLKRPLQRGELFCRLQTSHLDPNFLKILINFDNVAFGSICSVRSFKHSYIDCICELGFKG